jgi:gluconokinase
MPPLQVVVMGVTGTGKSTIGELVAADLGVELIEGDSYHPTANIEKMSSGRPLTDEDRRAWLETLASLLAAGRAQDRTAVLACSALRRTYRDILRGDIPTDEVFFIHLHADFDVLDARMRAREHFMPPALLQSQFDTLEPLEPDEAGVLVDVALPVDEVMGQVREALAAWRPSLR